MNKNLKQEIINKAQFPYGKRQVQYQSLQGMMGIRNMSHRYKVMKFPASFEGKSVLDLGCSLGKVCIDAMSRGALSAVGLDNRKETVDVGNKYLSSIRSKAKIFLFDINKGLDVLKLLIGDNKFDYVFALSIWKHVQHKPLWDIINYYCKEKLWFEGHNNQSSKKIKGVLTSNIININKVVYLGTTTDRGKRANFLVWKILN